MKAWIVYHRNDSIKNKRYIEFYKEEGKLRGIDFSLVLIEEVKFGVKHGKRYLEVNGEQVERPDFIVNRSIHPLLVKQFECFNIPVFNNAKVCEICNNKALTYQYVSQLGIPMVDSYFYENEQYEECISKLPDDQYVIKAVAGHGGSQVFLYNQNDKGNISVGLNGADFVLQPLTGSRHQDVRVYVIGNRIIAAVQRTALSGFKSNFSLGGDVCLYSLSKEEEEIVYSICNLFEFGMVGIDFIIGDQGEFIFNEIEDVVGARMLYQCSDLNLVGIYLDFIVEKLKCFEQIK